MTIDLGERLVWLGFTPRTDFILQNDSDGQGPRIADWLSASPQPTADAVAAATQPTAPLWAYLRAERDQRLAACDYTQLPDAPEANKAAWATYRQALRDLPEATVDPTNPVWPVAPGT
jgi:hypothetical protein